jgi:hypothetical protein
MIRRFVIACAALSLFAGVPALAQDTAAMVAKADTAFAAGDYLTAAPLYGLLKDRVTDPQKKAAIEERLRFIQRQMEAMKAQGLVPATQPADAASAGIATGSNRTPHKRPESGKPLEMTLHELGNFDFDENLDTAVPADVQALSGVTVKLPGQMMPLDQVGKVTRFILVNDLMSCCFGQAPKVQQIVYVELPKDKWIEPTSERISVEGKLTVRIKKEDGYVVSLFEVEPSSIKLAAQ